MKFITIWNQFQIKWMEASRTGLTPVNVPKHVVEGHRIRRGPAPTHLPRSEGGTALERLFERYTVLSESVLVRDVFKYHIWELWLMQFLNL